MTSESARSIPAKRVRSSGTHSAAPPYAPSTWNHSVVFGAHVGDTGEVVDRAGVGRARAGDHRAQWVVVDGRTQLTARQAAAFVADDLHDIEIEQPRRLVHG